MPCDGDDLNVGIRIIKDIEIEGLISNRGRDRFIPLVGVQNVHNVIAERRECVVIIAGIDWGVPVGVDNVIVKCLGVYTGIVLQNAEYIGGAKIDHNGIAVCHFQENSQNLAGGGLI